MKWELSLAASKMGETWSEGGPPLLGLALSAIGYCSAEITMILQSLRSAAQTSHLHHYLQQITHLAQMRDHCSAISCHVVNVATVDHNRKTSPDAAVGCC